MHPLMETLRRRVVNFRSRAGVGYDGTMSDNRDRYRIVPNEMALLVVDFQERLAAAMPQVERLASQRNILLLMELAQRQAWPVVVSEQYPKGLGATVEPLASALATRPDIHRLEKLHFSAGDAPGFREIFDRLERPRWVVTGMETHVCVYQTARSLLSMGAHVFVPEDTVVSRSPANRHRGLALMGSMGATITCTETVIFDALGVAGTDDFKALSKQLR